MSKVVEPYWRAVQMALPIIVHQRDLMCGREAVDEAFGDARHKAFVALNNHVHARKRWGFGWIQQGILPAFNVAKDKRVLID
jgi:hypothetical protein